MALALPDPSNVMTHLGQISSQSGITAFNQHFPRVFIHRFWGIWVVGNAVGAGYQWLSKT
jgi:hypothetical protein